MLQDPQWMPEIMAGINFQQYVQQCLPLHLTEALHGGSLAPSLWRHKVQVT